jgi:hypothetical protein
VTVQLGLTLNRRLRVGRLSVYIEPRDAWIGVYVARDAIYLLLVPLLVFRWQRQTVRAQRLAPPGAGSCSINRSGVKINGC